MQEQSVETDRCQQRRGVDELQLANFEEGRCQAIRPGMSQRPSARDGRKSIANQDQQSRRLYDLTSYVSGLRLCLFN